MTIDQLLTLDAIVKNGSFKAASEAMHKTQPSLSVAIKNLEEELGFLLFNREAYRPVLSDDGKTFYKKTLTTLAEFSKLKQLGLEMGAGNESQIDICVDAIFPIGKISSILSSYLESHTSVALNINTDVLNGVMAKLKSESVDFALGPEFIDEDIEAVKIQEVHLLPVIAPLVLNKIQNQLEKLKEFPLIVVESSIRKTYSQVLGSISDNHWYTTDFYMKQQLIESGLGWGRLPEHQIKNSLASGELVHLDIFTEIQSKKIPLYLLRLRGKVMGPNTKKLWNNLSQKLN